MGTKTIRRLFLYHTTILLYHPVGPSGKKPVIPVNNGLTPVWIFILLADICAINICGAGFPIYIALQCYRELYPQRCPNPFQFLYIHRAVQIRTVPTGYPIVGQFAVKDYILTLIVIIPHRMPLMVYCPLVYQMRFSQNLVRLLAFYN